MVVASLVTKALTASSAEYLWIAHQHIKCLQHIATREGLVKNFSVTG